MKVLRNYFLIILLVLVYWAQNIAQQKSNLQIIHSRTHDVIKTLDLKPIQQMDSTKQLNLIIALPLRNQSTLNNLLREIYDPYSSQFHHFLTHEEFVSEFGPSEQDYNSVIAFAKSNGFNINRTYSDKMILDVSGTVTTIENALNVHMEMFHHPTENRDFFAPDADPSMNISTPISSIEGLSDYQKPRPAGFDNGNNSNIKPAAYNGSGPYGSYRGKDFRAAYAPGVTLDGSGQKVGLIEFGGGFYQNDIDSYDNVSGIRHVPIKPVFIPPDTAQDYRDTSFVKEVSLDIEMANAMAPGLDSIIVYYGYFPDAVLDTMAKNTSVKQFSASWSFWTDQYCHAYFLEFATQGQSFFNASGDWGAWGGEYGPTIGDTLVTIVGGTDLSMNGTGGSYLSESVYNFSNGTVASGGGIDTNVLIPTYQKNIDTSLNGGSDVYRNGPDVAMVADDIDYLTYGVEDWGGNGTSYSSPLWAAFTALINQQQVSFAESSIGCINYLIYPISKTPLYSSVFHDVSSGNNKLTPGAFGYNAVTGYDLCTGLGSPNGQSLINDLPEAQLFALAYQNQSTYYGASSDNHNRTLAKGNNLYETFSSGGEIFVRQSSNNGSSWNYTNRISIGNGNNSVPSIVVYPTTATTDTVNVVWQRSLGSNYYDIYYAMSGNSGASWSSPILLEHNVLVSSYQYGGPQPVIAGIATTNAPPPPAGPVQPMLPTTYYHGVLVVYTSNAGLYSTYDYFKNSIYGGWTNPVSIRTTAPGSEVWFPSLASYGGTSCSTANLSYDARYYHKIYSNSFSTATNSWSGEAVVYDGSAQMSYDRQSCIAASGYLFDAWNSYNSSTGYYTVKFREGTYPNTWQSWQWTYPGTTANYWYPSIASYYSSNYYVAITDYSSPGNQVLLHKANFSTQTWQTYTVGSNALFPNIPNINNDCGNYNPVEVWTGTGNGNSYPLSISSQDFPKESVPDENSKITIYQRAISSGNVSVELSNVSATTNQGQNISIPLKSFDYTKDADMSDPWQYLQTEDSTAIAGVSNVTLNLSVTTSSNAKADSIQLPAQTAANAVTPTELDVYNGGQLIYTRTLTGKDAIVNKKIEFPIPGETLLGLKPVIKFSAQGNQSADVKFSTIENTISTAPNLTEQLASNTVTPTSFNLRQNYPNPFNPTTIISYDLPRSGFVTLKVYDILGREVSTLYNGNQNVGTYNVSFDASKLASGVYFYQLKSGDYTSIKKMVLLK